MKLPSAIQHIAVTRIHSPSFQQQLRLSERIFNRKRPLSFATVIGSILQKISRSLPIEAGLLGDILKQRPVSKQALSKARYKIGVSAFQDYLKRL